MALPEDPYGEVPAATVVVAAAAAPGTFRATLWFGSFLARSMPVKSFFYFPFSFPIIFLCFLVYSSYVLYFYCTVSILYFYFSEFTQQLYIYVWVRDPPAVSSLPAHDWTCDRAIIVLEHDLPFSSASIFLFFITWLTIDGIEKITYLRQVRNFQNFIQRFVIRGLIVTFDVMIT